MKEMIKKYRGSLISSILVILAGVLVGFTSTHGKWINVFFVVTHCIFVAIIFYDNRSRQQSPKVIILMIVSTKNPAVAKKASILSFTKSKNVTLSAVLS